MMNRIRRKEENRNETTCVGRGKKIQTSGDKFPLRDELTDAVNSIRAQCLSLGFQLGVVSIDEGQGTILYNNETQKIVVLSKIIGMGHNHIITALLLPLSELLRLSSNKSNKYSNCTPKKVNINKVAIELSKP